MKMLSLFSGVGMIDLAASWAGIETVAFCEIEEYPQTILRRRFPNVPIYSDVRELTAEKLKTDGIPKIDIISGGFPCQDVSTAGKRTGFVDSEGNVTRSGLWGEYARLICELKPRWIVAENVAGLLSISAAGIRGEDSELYSETWPKWGIVLDGLAMELPMLERHINESECLLWHTSDCSDRRSPKSKQQGVNNQVKAYWRTPQSHNGAQGPKSKMFYEECLKTGQSAITLVDQVKNQLANKVKLNKTEGQLNADWVELLMGLPIGWTDIDVANEDIESWTGWPAAINVEQYAYEPPRVIVGQKNRAKRLKALGNGCVPQQIYLVFAAIREMNK